MTFEREIAEHTHRRTKARAMGSKRKLEEFAAAGILNARQRITTLLDEGSFQEVGLFAVSERPEDADRSPGDGVVTGYGRVDGREIAIIAYDFTALGASSAPVASQKFQHIRKVSISRGIPMVVLGEAGGARIPDVMGARGIARTRSHQVYDRRRQSPWITAILGQSYGSSSWKAAMSDFVLMRKGAVLAVSSPKVTAVAISEEVDPEDLGGWRLRTETTGEVDQAYATDQEVLAAIRRFLGYMPSNANEPPPRAPVPAGSGDDMARILEIVPAQRERVYDVRKVIEAIVDKGSFFPIKERFAKVLSCGLGRIDGRVVGLIASNPIFKGGALDPQACRKATSFIVMCDSFNIPLVFLTDTPGFLVGIDGEKLGLAGQIMNFNHALEMATVPKLAVIMRKSYGQAYINMGGSADEIAAWFSADVSFMDPAAAVNVLHGIKRNDDPARFEDLREELSRNTGPYDLAAGFLAQDVIDPRETRSWLARMLAVHELRSTGGISRHNMATWPYNF
ncbi:methylmalonyl-CoA carboxyltransferase [Roseomonas soli]|uniref:Methylmalonyl-CoA carboxyltransferase n=2 Tax=Neoroseomonas soli TaxID=1081025 RepID=A0A9X9WTK0_9PROT|nr:methylmalonyl-CoA carboxyltransferase [Neoroseomonas soli]